MPNLTMQVKQVGGKAKYSQMSGSALTQESASNDISIRSSGAKVIFVNYHNRNKYSEVLSRQTFK